MVDYAKWLAGQNRRPIHTTRRAIAAWQRILVDPRQVEIWRGGKEQPKQTVRIIMNTAGSSESAENGVSATIRSGVLFGVKNHPTVAGTDVQRGDLFRVDGQLYRVESVTFHRGEVQAQFVRAE